MRELNCYYVKVVLCRLQESNELYEKKLKELEKEHRDDLHKVPQSIAVVITVGQCVTSNSGIIEGGNEEGRRRVHNEEAPKESG